MKKVIAMVLIIGVLMSSAIFVFAGEEPDPKKVVITNPLVVENPPIVIINEEPDPKK